jgi:hypothetical protein
MVSSIFAYDNATFENLLKRQNIIANDVKNKINNQEYINSKVNDLYKEVDKVRKELGFTGKNSLDNKTVKDILNGVDVGNMKTYTDSTGDILKAVQDSQKAYNDTLKKGISDWQKRMMMEDGKLYIKNADEIAKHADSVTNQDRLYLFVSSSMPTNTWKNYIYDIDRYKLNGTAFLILRGCVNGCSTVHPTAEFLNPLIIKNAQTKDYYDVQAWIDPLLYRMYKITQVPCVVYASGLTLYNAEISEGIADNLKTKPNVYKSCGDYSLKYHVSELYEQSKSQFLKDLLFKMENEDEKSYYNNNNSNN